MVGDVFFILLAILGLSLLAEAMGSWFVLVKCVGGAYLILLGIKVSRDNSKVVEGRGSAESSLLSSFLTGLLITLCDQKAILFYLVLFPAFLDLSTVSVFGIVVIVAIAILAVGSSKLFYAFMADRARLLISSRAHKGMNIAAGSVMIAVGVFMMIKS